MRRHLRYFFGSFITVAASVGVVATYALLVDPARAAETITYEYDALGRLTKKNSAGTVNTGKKVTVCYDAAGNRKVYNVAANGASVVCLVTAFTQPVSPTPASPTPVAPPPLAPPPVLPPREEFECDLGGRHSCR